MRFTITKLASLLIILISIQKLSADLCDCSEHPIPHYDTQGHIQGIGALNITMLKELEKAAQANPEICGA